MATVYLAHDLRHDRRVALKVLLPELAAVFGRERFLREIQLTAQLQHPNILPVFDSGESAGQLWYTMPFADGESLRTRLEREGQLPVEDALRIAREVADALSYAHHHGIIHRDIKPENVLFANGRALVADFGIARALDAAGAEKLTQTGMGLGTPHYMSPEQSFGETALDGRTDQYALGCVLYEMLAGEPPYDGPTAQSIIAKRLSHAVPSVRSLRETVPESVEYALSVALARLPVDRFATTGEFIVALSADPPRSSKAVTRFHRWTRQRRVTVSAVLAVIGAAIGWTVLRASPTIPASASVIAVFPFAPTAPDSALTRLGRDLAGTVSSSLDGVGEIRTVDRLTIMAQVPANATPLPLAEAAALGRRLGATSVVHGSISRDGARVRLDVGLYTADDLVPLGHGTVLAAADSLSALTDSVVWQLLGDIWRRGTPPSPTIAAVTTRSVPALRAYLDGERELVAGFGDRAREAFGRAIAADSTFWFAYYRYDNSMGWIGDGDGADSTITAAYWNHRQLLPEKERLLIEASRGDSGLVRQRAQLEALVARYPDYWPAWWVLADLLHHTYPIIGTTTDDKRKALEHVVALNPSMVMGWRHLAEVYLVDHDSALSVALDAMDHLGARATFMADEHVDMELLMRTLLAMQRNRPAGALLDSVYESALKPESDLFYPMHLLMIAGYGARQIELNQRLLRHGLSSQDSRTAADVIGMSWAMRGAWDSALVARDRLHPEPNDTLWVLGSYRMAVLGAWLGELPISAAERRRPDAVRLAQTRSPGYAAELVWLDGLLAVAARDLDGVTAARTALRSSGGRFVAELDRSLGAFASALRGNLRAAADTMTALEWRLGDTHPGFAFSRATPHALLRSVDRIAASDWLLALGDSAQAERLLTWLDAASGPFVAKFEVKPQAYLRVARIEGGHGHPDAARRAWEQFLVRYDMPNPAHQPLVAEARAALSRLATPRGTP